MKKINTAKGENISIEFKEYENVLFNRKLIRHKMRILQSKLHKMATYDACKKQMPANLCHVLMTKDTF